MSTLTTIGFDADDTLWHNERYFRFTQDRFTEFLSEHAEKQHLLDRLLQAERRNVGHYGFGIKGFTLSMIETAIEVTDGRVPANIIAEILSAGREMLAHPVEPFPGALDALEALHQSHRLVLITKGDLFDQERKLAQSGLGDMFEAVEIVSDKAEITYQRIFTQHGDGPDRAMMVGNSVKSDILPAIAAGSWATHVPYELTFALEHAEVPASHPKFRSIVDLSKLQDVIAAIS